MENTLDGYGYTGAVLMYLTKTLDTINHELLIAKLYSYGLFKDALKLIFSYMSVDKEARLTNRRANLIQYLS